MSADKVRVTHASLKPGDACPNCQKGTVYESVKPGHLVRIRGQAPLGATVYELQKLRCNLCGQIFTAQTPPEVGANKYDAESASMIALLKYGSGLRVLSVGLKKTELFRRHRSFEACPDSSRASSNRDVRTIRWRASGVPSNSRRG